MTTSKEGGKLFSKSERFLLKLTWNKLQGKIDSLAINAFHNMFQAHPEILLLLLQKTRCFKRKEDILVFEVEEDKW